MPCAEPLLAFPEEVVGVAHRARRPPRAQEPLDLVEDRGRDRGLRRLRHRRARRRGVTSTTSFSADVEADVGAPDVVEDDEVGVLRLEHRALALEPLLAVLGAEGDEHLAGALLLAERARDVRRRLELDRPRARRPSAAWPRAPRPAGSRRRRPRAARRRRPASASAASSIDSAVGVGIVSTPCGRRTARFAASRTTSAPRRRASSASATPIRPDERLPTKRTRVERLARAAGGDEHAPAGERAGREQLRRRARRSRRARPAGRPPTRPRPSRPRRGRRARRRARGASRRSRASPDAPTCAGSSPGRRAPARDGRAPPR